MVDLFRSVSEEQKYLRHHLLTDGDGCRQGLYSSCSDFMSPIDVKRMQLARRRRLEFQRLRSLYHNDPRGGGGEAIADDGRCPRKRRVRDLCVRSDATLIAKKRAVAVPLPFAKIPADSPDCARGSDAVQDGVSRLKEQKRGVREDLRRVASVSHGSVSIIGRRREMEDAVTAKLGLFTRDSRRYDYFGVFDGHGGSSVANSCRDRLHQIVLEEMEGGGDEVKEGEVNWERIMAASFEKMDREVNDPGRFGAETGNVNAGSTAVVAVVGEDRLVVANCGDSRAVLSRGGIVVPMSNDHKPDRKDELERIEVSGGRVINWNGNRVLGVLATSRSIGDCFLKPFVISEPEVREVERTDADEFLILASDGLWDVISNEVACQVVRRCLDGRIKRKGRPAEECCAAQAAAAVLAELALARGSTDNISVIVVELKEAQTISV